MDEEQALLIQVKVPVCITLELSLEDAESMLLDELCDVVDCVLEEASDGETRRLSTHTVARREIQVAWNLAPHWDNLPDDECELTLTHEGLFPRD